MQEEDEVAKHRVTIREAAHKAQIFQQTVSNGINGTRRMSEQTKKECNLL